MERRCESCGKSFETRSARARFCGSTCRSRAHRGQLGQPGLSVIRSVPEAPDAAPAAEPAVQPVGALTESVEKQLRDVGRLDSVHGRAAVDMARRIDANQTAPLSQVAAAHRELRAAVAE